MTILLAVVAGAALGFVLTRGDFCFHSTWRRVMAAPRDYSLLRAYLVMLVVATPLVQMLIATRIIDPWVPPLAWKAAIVGGVIFGIGMVVASTCISGMFYKLGAGMFGMVVALVAWAIGDLLTYRWGLSGLRESLNDDVITATDGGQEVTATAVSVFGPASPVVVALIGGWIISRLWRSHSDESGMTPRQRLWGWVPLGVAAGLVTAGAWLLTRWHGFDYTYGTSGVPSQIWGRIVDGADTPMWIPLGLVSVIPGALLAAKLSGTFWARGEAGRRYGELAAGGLLMGIGAGIAGGCNLGHSMVGVPLLSFGSILTTLSIIAGLTLADRVLRLVTTPASTPASL